MTLISATRPVECTERTTWSTPGRGHLEGFFFFLCLSSVLRGSPESRPPPASRVRRMPCRGRFGQGDGGARPCRAGVSSQDVRQDSGIPTAGGVGKLRSPPQGGGRVCESGALLVSSAPAAAAAARSKGVRGGARHQNISRGIQYRCLIIKRRGGRNQTS